MSQHRVNTSENWSRRYAHDEKLLGRELLDERGNGVLKSLVRTLKFDRISDESGDLRIGENDRFGPGALQPGMISRRRAASAIEAAPTSAKIGCDAHQYLGVIDRVTGFVSRLQEPDGQPSPT